MERELRAEDLFAAPKTVSDVGVDPNYEVVVKLSSCGKLGLPAVVHAKDYTFDDTLLFSKANNTNESAIVLDLLKSLVYEDIDLSKVTRQDALEILLAIQGTYYSSYIEKEYLIDESLTGEQRTARENRRTASIPINAIQTTPFSSDAAIPVKISNSRLEVLFDYPRLMHDVKARQWIDTKFAEKDNSMAGAMSHRASGTASANELKALSDYENEKAYEYVRVLTAQQILSFNGKALSTIDEQLEAMHKVPITVLSLFTSILTSRLKFGVQNEVTFKDEETNETLTRRFDFRYSDFLSSVEQRDSSRFDVSFG